MLIPEDHFINIKIIFIVFSVQFNHGSVPYQKINFLITIFFNRNNESF